MSLKTGTWAGMNYAIEQEGSDYVCYLTGTQTETVSRSGCPFGSSSTYKVTKVVCNNLKIIDGYRFFYYESDVTTVKFGTNIDSSEMASTEEMFYLTDIESIIGIENLNLSAVINMDGMFDSCYDLISLGTLGQAPLVETVERLFYGCNKLTSIDISNLNLTNVKNYEEMFENCKKLTTIKLPQLNTTDVVSFREMFSSCENLVDLDMSIFTNTKPSSLYSMFNNCKKITEIDLAMMDWSNVSDIRYCFNRCTALTKFEWKYNAPNLTYVEYLFSGCSSLETVDLSQWVPSARREYSLINFFNNCKKLQSIVWPDNLKVSNLDHTFYGLSLEVIDLSKLDLSQVKSLDNTFCSCKNLVNIIWPSNFTANNVESLSHTFADCDSLVLVDLNHWNVQKVTTVAGLFAYCSALSEVNIGAWNLQSCLDFSRMFESCYHLQSVPTENWTMPLAVNVSAMFENCISLVEILLSRWSPATTDWCDTAYFATGCTNLKRVVLGHNKSMKSEGWHFNANDAVYKAFTPNIVSWNEIDGEDYRTYEANSNPWLPWPDERSTETSINRTITLENTSSPSNMKLIYKYNFEIDDYVEVYKIDSDSVETLVLTLEGQGIDDNMEALLTDDSLDLTNCAAIKIVEHFASRTKNHFHPSDYGLYYGYYFILTDNISVKNEQWTEPASSLTNAFVTIDNSAFGQCENLQFLQLNIPDAVDRGLSEEAAAHLVLAGEWFTKPLRLSRLHKIILQ